VSYVSALARECFDSEIRLNIFRSALDEIGALKKQGYTVILATGAHEAIAMAFGQYVGADLTVCTKSVIHNGKYGWRTDGAIPYRDKKRDLVKAAIVGLGTQRPTITVYTDEKKDLALLDIADHCVAVNADSVIQEAVLKRRGRVTTFK
jgi:phosphoserine phosphatase